MTSVKNFRAAWGLVVARKPTIALSLVMQFLRERD